MQILKFIYQLFGPALQINCQNYMKITETSIKGKNQCNNNKNKKLINWQLNKLKLKCQQNAKHGFVSDVACFAKPFNKASQF